MEMLAREVSPFRRLDREEWAKLRADTAMTLTQADLDELRGLNDRIDLAEVEAIYLPLSRLLNLYVAATQKLFRATNSFLHSEDRKVPYVIGIAGSVAYCGGCCRAGPIIPRSISSRLTASCCRTRSWSATD
jgi:type I pantothenate kinase